MNFTHSALVNLILTAACAKGKEKNNECGSPRAVGERIKAGVVVPPAHNIIGEHSWQNKYLTQLSCCTAFLDPRQLLLGGWMGRMVRNACRFFRAALREHLQMLGFWRTRVLVCVCMMRFEALGGGSGFAIVLCFNADFNFSFAE